MRKRTILLLLALVLCAGLLGCSQSDNAGVPIEEAFNPIPDVDVDLIYQQLVQREEFVYTIPVVTDAMVYRYRLEDGCQEEMNLLFIITNEFEPDVNDSDNFTKYDGIYMVDLDTQELYRPEEIDFNDATLDGQGWNMTTRETASICFYTFFVKYYIYDTARIWRDEETIVWATKDTIYTVNEWLNAERYDELIQTFPITKELGGVSMTAREAMALVGAEPEVVKEKIKTAGDILLYMIVADVRSADGDIHAEIDGDVWHWNMCAEEVLMRRVGGCGALSNLAMYLLEDDYEDMGFFGHTLYKGLGGRHVYLYILYEGSYCVVDYMDYIYNYDSEINRPPVIKMDSLAEWPERIGEKYIAEDICLIQYEPSGKMHLPMIYDEEAEIFYVAEGGDYVVLYQAEDGFRLEEKPFPGDWYNWNTWGEIYQAPHIKPENIDSYAIASELGGVTLTAEDAYALVDAAPEVVQGKVKTAGDLLMYMLAADMNRGGLDVRGTVNGRQWHWNRSAKEVMERRLGGCGSQANLAMYLLEGDYEEIGLVDLVYSPETLSGGHIVNYIVYEGEYYVIDFSWYFSKNYDPNWDYTIVAFESLDEYPELAEKLYGNVNLIFTYSDAKRHYPCVYFLKEWYEREDIPYDYFWYPEGVEYTLLYDSGDGYHYGTMPFDISVCDWTVYW